MVKIAGVVIVYYPDIDQLLYNISSYINHVDRLFVVFNSPVSIEETERLISCYPQLQIILNGYNSGIAVVLNQTAEKAMNLGYEWLLTMDQDSRFQSENFFNSCIMANHQNAAIFSPNHELKVEVEGVTALLSDEVLSVITSGNLLNLKIWKELNGFEEKLFIDEVDHDYCLKAVSHGFKVIRFRYIPLSHELGEPKEVRLLFKRYFYHLHPPVRSYYIFRNNFYIFKKYKKLFPEFINFRKRVLLKDFIKLMLFSPERMSNIRYIYHGLRDYAFGQYGPLQD